MQPVQPASQPRHCQSSEPTYLTYRCAGPSPSPRPTSTTPFSLSAPCIALQPTTCCPLSTESTHDTQTPQPNFTRPPRHNLDLSTDTTTFPPSLHHPRDRTNHPVSSVSRPPPTLNTPPFAGDPNARAACRPRRTPSPSHHLHPVIHSARARPSRHSNSSILTPFQSDTTLPCRKIGHRLFRAYAWVVRTQQPVGPCSASPC